jgi:hypothetical protein
VRTRDAINLGEFAQMGQLLIPKPNPLLSMTIKWRIPAFLLAAVLTYAPSYGWGQQSPSNDQHSAGQDMKHAGRDTKNAAKDTGHAVKKGTTKAYHAATKGAKKAYNKSKNTTKGAARGAQQGAQQPH